MGKDTGFLDYNRVNNADIPPKERIKNFEEFHRPLDVSERRKQAARCMNCGVPFCQSAMELSGMVTGCPLHNLIPEWNDELYREHDRHAFANALEELAVMDEKTIDSKRSSCYEYIRSVNEESLVNTGYRTIFG